MTLFDEVQTGNAKLSVIGLGYVGLPLAIELAKLYHVVGFDINQEILASYKSGVDVTHEVGNKALEETSMAFSAKAEDLNACKWHIVAVPTPINPDKTPDLDPVIAASQMLGKYLNKGSIVIYESTVYPGTTEEICIPILEERSGLVHGQDFKVGYSPERINPGDKINTLSDITKIVSGSDQAALENISKLYESIIQAGIHEAKSIKIAEAAKVIENAQRDVNIAFMNELSMIFNKMGINTKAVLEAAETKWNFLAFTPGLVGGHCIGVDPYYFTYKAEQLGYHSQIILAGRKINDDMGKHIVANIIKTMVKARLPISDGRIAILGLTFKENVADVRNSKVIEIINELREYNLEVLVHEPLADPEVARDEFGIHLVSQEALRDLDCIVMAVPHDIFKASFDMKTLSTFYRSHRKVLVDVKGVYDQAKWENEGYYYWSL